MIVEVQYTITGKFKVNSNDIEKGLSFQEVEEAIKTDPWEGDHDPRYDWDNQTITVTKLKGDDVDLEDDDDDDDTK